MHDGWRSANTSRSRAMGDRAMNVLARGGLHGTSKSVLVVCVTRRVQGGGASLAVTSRTASLAEVSVEVHESLRVSKVVRGCIFSAQVMRDTSHH